MERENLWAPWRIPYIRDIEKTDGCFLCHDFAHPEADAENLVVWRTERSLVVLNRFPYNNGHLLVAPARHVADLDEASEEEMLELMKDAYYDLRGWDRATGIPTQEKLQELDLEDLIPDLWG